MKITIIGAGNLGISIAKGLLTSNFILPKNLTLSRRNTTSLSFFKEEGVNITNNNVEAIKNGNLIILAIKPFNCNEILNEIKKHLTENQILISVVTGVAINDIQQIIGNDFVICRAMPNTAIEIKESLTTLCYNKNIKKPKKDLIESMFNVLGKTVEIEEKLMDSATVLGACGIAYALRFIRANIQAGIEIGFDAKTAKIIASQTIKGAAELLIQKNSHPEQEIDVVTTPKGCTIAGLNEMEHQGFSSSLIKGVITSYKKIIEK